MKQSRTFAGILILLMITGLFMSSCTEEDEIIDPTTDARDNFTGTWLCQESTKSTDNTYPVTIVADPSNSAQVLLKNYMQLGVEIEAYAIVTESTITVPTQEIGSGESWTVSAFGTLTGENQIEFSKYNGNQLQLTAVFTRQK